MMGVQHKAVGIGFGLASSMYLAEALEAPAPAVLAFATCVAGSMLPDIDHDKTKIGRKRKFATDLLSKLTTSAIMAIIAVGTIIIVALSVGMINVGISLEQVALAVILALAFIVVRKMISKSSTFKWMTKHRGLMHTLIPPIIIFIAAGASDFIYWCSAFIGLGIGYVSHLLADMLTVEGCPVLWPIYKGNIRLLKLKTKNASTWLAAIALAALPVVLIMLYLGV